MKKEMDQIMISDERNFIPIRNMHFEHVNPHGAGFQDCSPGYGEKNHKRTNYVLHYITAGKGTFCTDGKKYELSKGDTFLIRPDREISYFASKDNPWSYIWADFNGTSAKLLDSIEDDVFSLNGELFENIKESATFFDTRELYLSSCISLILCHILDSRKKLDIVSTVKGYIASGRVLTLKISDIAKFMNISTVHLSRTFKEKTGISLNDYLLKKKMEKASHWLNLDYKVSEIAKSLGYSDPTSFFRAFKSYYGYPPSKHKKADAVHKTSATPASSQSLQEANIISDTLDEKMMLAKQYLRKGYQPMEVAHMIEFIGDNPLDISIFDEAYKKFFGYPSSEEKFK